MDIIVVTGMSGAGKSVVGNVLEDFGYYCIDNIPVSLISQFIELYLKQDGKNQKVALIVDVRGCDDFSFLLSSLRDIDKSNGQSCRVIYMDAERSVLINRYKESRHIHPLVLAKQLTLTDAIEEERRMLSSVKVRADYVIDTSKLSVAACRDKIISIISEKDAPLIGISCVSFGFKYGIPTDSDLLFDVRCFPNPYYIDELKHRTGLDKPVSDYVLSFASVNSFCQKLTDMLDSLIPLYIEDGRSHLTVSIGCTGGKHRSVTIAEALAKYLSGRKDCKPTVTHRDINK